MRDWDGRMRRSASRRRLRATKARSSAMDGQGARRKMRLNAVGRGSSRLIAHALIFWRWQWSSRVGRPWKITVVCGLEVAALRLITLGSQEGGWILRMITVVNALLRLITHGDIFCDPLGSLVL